MSQPVDPLSQKENQPGPINYANMTQNQQRTLAEAVRANTNPENVPNENQGIIISAIQGTPIAEYIYAVV